MDGCALRMTVKILINYKEELIMEFPKSVVFSRLTCILLNTVF